MIKVAVIDDHSVVVAGLTFVLSRVDGMKVVATAESAENIVELYERHGPDVILLDIRMPVVGGLDALATLKQTHPESKVAILTTSDMEEDVFRAMKLGAAGYIMKDARPSEIAAAVKTVALGGSYMPESIRRVLEVRRGVKGLSAREHSILQCAAKGLSNPEIAELLGISVNSVKTHLRHVFEKMDVEDRVEAVTLAFSRGILSS